MTPYFYEKVEIKIKILPLDKILISILKNQNVIFLKLFINLYLESLDLQDIFLCVGFSNTFF